MSDHWLWLTIAVALISACILQLFIRRLVGAHRGEQILSLPLVTEQELAIETAGSFVLHAEGPRLSRAFGRLDYQLIGLSDRSLVPIARTLVPFPSSGLSRSRLSRGTFTLDAPGRFRLSVSGITDPSVARNHALVITHDRRAVKVVSILAIVFSGVGLVAGAVCAILLYLLNR